MGRRSDQLDAHANALDEFRDAFLTLLDLRAKPKVKEAAVAKQRSEVNRLSGPAAVALEAAKLYMGTRDPPNVGGRQQVFNVAQNWSLALDPSPASPLRPQDVTDFAERGASQLRARAERERQRERTLAGFAARFIRWPLEVRDIAGLPPKSAGGRAVLSLAVLVQTAVTTAIGIWVTQLLT